MPSVADQQMNALDALVSPYGVVSVTRRYRSQGWMADLHGCHAEGGSGRPGAGADHHSSEGGGRSYGDPARARLVAIAEAAERYSAYEPPTAEHRWAAASGLDGPVADVTRLPRCSATELANPDCPIVPFDPDAPIRWVQGLELVSSVRTWLPAVMSTYRLHPAVPAERFWYQLSTGFAVHHDPTEALVRAVLEVVERDAIALTWLQRMPLPPLPDIPVSPALEELLGASRRHFLRTLLFDATTDLGVPTVYCLQLSEHDRRVRHVVGCAAGRTLSAAAEKALAEALGVRGALYGDAAEPPRSPRSPRSPTVPATWPHHGGPTRSRSCTPRPRGRRAPNSPGCPPIRAPRSPSCSTASRRWACRCTPSTGATASCAPSA